MSLHGREMYDFGPYTVEPKERTLLRDGQAVPLPPKAFDLLVVLVTRARRLVTKEELLKEVWPGTFVEEANLSYTVALLRKALGDEGERHEYIDTVPKRGYRFVAPVTEPRADPVLAASHQAEPAPAKRSKPSPAALVVGALVLLLLAGLVAWAWPGRGAGLSVLVFGDLLGPWVAPRPAADRVVRFEVAPPAGTVFWVDPETPGAAVVSPDGRSIAFAARAGVEPVRLYVRPLAGTAARALAGTEGAQYPFWSPDSRFVGFFAGGKLKKIEAEGGAALALCAAAEVKGASWGRQGVIVFAPTPTSPIHRVSDAGGESSPVSQLDPALGHDSHRHPRFLPDGKHFLYLARTPAGGMEGAYAILVGSIDGGPGKELLKSPAAAVYASGHLLFVRERTLMAQPFNPQRLEFAGEAVPVAEDVGPINQWGAAAIFSASDDGVLVYQAIDLSRPDRQLTWRDRSGALVGRLGDRGRYRNITLSPRGDFAAATLVDATSGSTDVWIYEIARGLRTRFTLGPGLQDWPIWSPDGNTVTYTSERNGRFGVYRKPAAGGGAEELLLESKRLVVPSSFSPDGGLFFFSVSGEKTDWDLWVLPLQGERKPYPLLQTPCAEGDGVQSPDARWLAFDSTESGRDEIYVMPFPGPGRKWRVSTEGGTFPRWRADGKEIFYHAPSGAIMAVDIEARAEVLTVGRGRPLFEMAPPRYGYDYCPTLDGRRFLVAEALKDEAPRPLTVVVNWTAALAKR